MAKFLTNGRPPPSLRDTSPRKCRGRGEALLTSPLILGEVSAELSEGALQSTTTTSRHSYSVSTCLLPAESKRDTMTNPQAVPTDPDPFADRRVHPRVMVALPAFLQANRARHSVQILDLSSGGAKLTCAAAVAIGSHVLLDCGSLACTGVVRWQGGGQLGLAFEQQLDPREVAALMDRSKALEALLKTRG